jgi:hypothetical protein
MAKGTGEEEQENEMNMGRAVVLDEECCVPCGACKAEEQIKQFATTQCLEVIPCL